MTSIPEQVFESALFQSYGYPVTIRGYQFIGGGCINNTIKLDTQEGPFFMKWNENDFDDMFETEARGLDLLRSAGNIRVPQVIHHGKVGESNFLLLEFISTNAPAIGFWSEFGASLAAQHRIGEEQFGLDHSNYIGRLPQKNERKQDWIDFFIENRLEVQLGLALYNNLVDQDFAKKFRLIYAQLPGIIPPSPPSLLHGDLWSGNFMSGPNGKAHIFDPAVYFGHREMEIAFTRLFGGFDAQFYLSYHEHYPMDPGFDDRVDVYNLYPLLVHVNLFGTSYLSGIQRTLRKYS